jgi:hypothetical protein
MTRQRGASRGVDSKKNNQNMTVAPSEAPSKTIPQATHLATPLDDNSSPPLQESLLANSLQGGEVALATLRDRVAGALAGLRRSFAAVRLQRAARRVLARRRFVRKLHALHARRVQELKQQNKWESVVLRKRQYDKAVEVLQDAAKAWLAARAAQHAVQQQEEPAWLVRAGEELEQMLRHWQDRQEERLVEERLVEEQKPQQRDPMGTPPGVGRQGRRAIDGTSPVGFAGFGKAVRAKGTRYPVPTKQSGGRQRKERIAQNAAARDAAAQESRDAAHRAALVAQACADSVQTEQEREERQLRAEREEARQLAVAIRVSMDWSGVGSGLQGTVEGDDGIDEQFKELCDAAGVAPEDIYRPTATTRTVEERVFARKCRRAGVTATCGGQRGQLRRLHVARARAEVLMRASLGANWRRVAERNLEVARARYAAQQWLATEAQVKGHGGAGGGSGRRVGGARG